MKSSSSINKDRAIKKKQTTITEEEPSDSFVSSIQTEKTIETVMSFNIFYNNLNQMFSKRKYRKVFYETTKREELYSKSNIINGILMSHLKINCAFQIIKKKFMKYTNCPPKGLEHWLTITDNLITVITNQIQSLPYLNQADQYETLTFYHLSNLYNNAMYCKKTNKVTECLNHLFLCEKIINSLSSHITYPETLNIIQKIYIFIASEHILDEDYSSAMGYLLKVIKICMKELEIETNTKEGMNNLNSNETCYNISLAFYQLGVCFENENDIDKADDCYINASWFAVSFLKNKSYRYVKFLKELSKRSSNYYNIHLILKELSHNRANEEKEEKKTINVNGTYNGDIKKMIRLRKIESYVDRLRIKELDYDDQELFNEVGKRPKPPMVHKMSYNVNLMNYLLSEDFKPVISEMKDLNVNYFTTETKSKIQKKINQMKTMQRTELSKRKDKQLQLNTCGNSSSKISSLNNQTTLQTNANTNGKSTCSVTKASKHKKSSTQYSFYSRNERYLSGGNSYRTPKIKYDKYVFNSTFQKKVSFISSKMEKEYKFQKELLKNKKNERMIIEQFDIEKSKKEADFFYKTQLNEEMRMIKDKEKTSKLNDKFKPHLSIFTKMKDIYENRLCKSLNKNLVNPFSTFLKTMLKDAPDSMKKELGIQPTQHKHKISKEKFNENVKEVANVNKTYINQFEYDIDNINKKEMKISKEIHSNDNKKAKYSNKSINYVNTNKSKNSSNIS